MVRTVLLLSAYASCVTTSYFFVTRTTRGVYFEMPTYQLCRAVLPLELRRPFRHCLRRSIAAYSLVPGLITPPCTRPAPNRISALALVVVQLDRPDVQSPKSKTRSYSAPDTTSIDHTRMVYLSSSFQWRPTGFAGIVSCPMSTDRPLSHSLSVLVTTQASVNDLPDQRRRRLRRPRGFAVLGS